MIPSKLLLLNWFVCIKSDKDICYMICFWVKFAASCAMSEFVIKLFANVKFSIVEVCASKIESNLAIDVVVRKYELRRKLQ